MEELKGLTKEGQALEAQAADRADLFLGEGKMVEVLAQDSKIHEEEDSSLALEELKALLMEVGLEEDLEPTVEGLLEVWVLEGDLEALETADGLEGLVME